MSLTLTHIRQTLDLQEKVKVGAGEKIVKNEKIGRKKNVEFTITSKGNKFFAYFDGEKYAGSYSNQKDVEKIAKEYLQLVGEELEENRAKRDAMRAMGRKSGKDAADIDTDATDKDREQADKNVIVQLRKVVSLRGMKPVEFSNGKKVKLNPKDAEKILRIYQNLKPASKLQLQTYVSKSPENFKKAVSELKEEVLNEAPKMKYALVGTDMKIYSMGSDERDLRLDRRSLEKRFKDVAPLKMARLKTAQAIGDKVDKSQLKEETLDEALPAHLAKLFDKDGNFKDPKKQKIFDRMMGDGIGKEIAQKMGRIQFRVDADSRNKKIKVYVDSNDETDAQRALKNHPAYISGALRVIPEEVELEEGKMKQLHDLISQGKSAQQIAKMLKLDVKTIQALMDETINKDSIVSEKVTPYVYNSFNEFVVHHGDKEETDTSTIKERALTKFELKKREKIAKDLPDAEFKKRYGDDWMNVKMGTATNMAKGES
jgi:hypothetical protein